jgi:hypothetical protein
LNGIARMPAAERAEVFAETAARKGLPEAIIEKDFFDLAVDYAVLGFIGPPSGISEVNSSTP